MNHVKLPAFDKRLNRLMDLAVLRHLARDDPKAITDYTNEILDLKRIILEELK